MLGARPGIEAILCVATTSAEIVTLQVVFIMLETEMLRTLWNVLVPVAIAYAAVLVLVFVFQSQLVFFPGTGREVVVTPQTYGLGFETVGIQTADGETLQAWWVPAEGARGTVLFFHGNAGNISHRVDYLLMFNRLRYSTLIVDYRGYGRSTGTPSEEGTYRDAEAAWDYLRHARLAQPRDVVIAGESLGAAVATRLAAEVGPRAVVLFSTFTSATDLGAEVYWFLPVRLIEPYWLRQPGEPETDPRAGIHRAQPRRRHRALRSRQAALRGGKRAQGIPGDAWRSQRRLHLHAAGVGRPAGSVPRPLRRRKEIGAADGRR